MNRLDGRGLIPGSVVKVWSGRHGFFHKGVVDWPDPLTGEPRVIHSAKGSFVRSSSLAQFAEGESVSVLWTPQNRQQQVVVIERMKSLAGMRYRLLEANCEHVVNWALTGRAYSEQLAVAGLAALSILLIVALAASSRG